MLDGAGTKGGDATDRKLGLLPHITQPGTGTAGLGRAGCGAELCQEVPMHGCASSQGQNMDLLH